MRRTVRALSTITIVALPLVNVASSAASAAVKTVTRKSVWKKITGPQAQANQWGYVEVVMTVKKTTVGKKTTRRVTGIVVPVYPDHTGRSVFISENAIPILINEALRAQMHPNIDLISGATYTSDAFMQSLQAAILKAKKV